MSAYSLPGFVVRGRFVGSLVEHGGRYVAGTGFVVREEDVPDALRGEAGVVPAR